jgi:hypothetical protein
MHPTFFEFLCHPGMLTRQGWPTGGYGVETVEDCVIETQTGYQLRSPEQQIDRAALLDSLKAVHNVVDKERAAAVVREPLYSFLDPGRAGAVG